MLSFGMSFDKKNSMNLGQCEDHNNRHHPTKSQLPKEAWFDEKGSYTVTKWDSKKIDLAKSLSKRKDAVLAIEFSLSLGNQADWRDAPTKEHPYGKPKKGMTKIIKALTEAAKAAAVNEFGAENVVGINLHLDESTPHVHIVVVPIHLGKLQAKQWTGGKAACEQLRERMWSTVSQFTPCDYVRGNEAGGKPHDSSKAAGGPLGPKPKPSMLDVAKAALSGSRTIEELKKAAGLLSVQVQSLFSKLKRAELALAVALRDLKASKSDSQELLKRQEIRLREETSKLRLANDKKLELLKFQLDEQRSMNAQLAKRNNELLAPKRFNLS